MGIVKEFSKKIMADAFESEKAGFPYEEYEKEPEMSQEEKILYEKVPKIYKVFYGVQGDIDNMLRDTLSPQAKDNLKKLDEAENWFNSFSENEMIEFLTALSELFGIDTEDLYIKEYLPSDAYDKIANYLTVDNLMQIIQISKQNAQQFDQEENFLNN